MSEIVVGTGKVVSFNYTLTDPGGDVLDQSAPDQPMDYLHGAQNIVPGLEDQMAGKKVGDSFEAVVAPADGYGIANPMGIQEVPRHAFPAEMDLQPGMQFVSKDDDGEMTPFWVAEIKDEAVMIDLNHPLAGVTLHFQVELTGIRDASDEEQSHGHPHGPDGHHHH